MAQRESLLLFEPLSGTSLSKLTTPTTRKECRIGQYTIVVMLADDGRFLGIEQIRVDADFLDLEQRMRVPSLDVDKYYHDEDDK